MPHSIQNSISVFCSPLYRSIDKAKLCACPPAGSVLIASCLDEAIYLWNAHSIQHITRKNIYSFASEFNFIGLMDLWCGSVCVCVCVIFFCFVFIVVAYLYACVSIENSMITSVCPKLLPCSAKYRSAVIRTKPYWLLCTMLLRRSKTKKKILMFALPEHWSPDLNKNNACCCSRSMDHYG